MQPPLFIRLIALICGLIVTVTALGGAAVSFRGVETEVPARAAAATEAPAEPVAPKVVRHHERFWLLFGFELVLIVAGGLSMLTGLGKFSPSFGLAASVLGATIFGAAGLAFLDARANLSSTSFAGAVLPVLEVRLVCALGLNALGGCAILLRQPRQFGRFFLGVGLIVPVLACGAGAALGKLGFLLKETTGSAELFRVGAIFLLGVIAIVLLSAGGHLIITAFEKASAEPQPDTR